MPEADVSRQAIRLAKRATPAPAAIQIASVAAIAFVWAHVRQALQHVAAMGAFSPYFAAT